MNDIEREIRTNLRNYGDNFTFKNYNLITKKLLKSNKFIAIYSEKLLTKIEKFYDYLWKLNDYVKIYNDSDIYVDDTNYMNNLFVTTKEIYSYEIINENHIINTLLERFKTHCEEIKMDNENIEIIDVKTITYEYLINVMILVNNM